MNYLPHEKLNITWTADEQGFELKLPWLSMEIGVNAQEKQWIQDATNNMHQNADNKNVQKFITQLKDYPIFYAKPRSIDDFNLDDLQASEPLNLDFTTPQSLLDGFNIPIGAALRDCAITQWTWDWDKILLKCRIDGTELYDPVSFVTYLICYRLEWESTTWSGQDGLGQLLERFMKEDENKFFQALGWISRQSWYVTTESCNALEPALKYFPKAEDLINHFIMDEAGHYKFMDMVFDDLELNKDDFEVGEGTKWLLSSHACMAKMSPLVFSAMINLFEAAFYEGEDPISRVVKKSSKPDAARGYDLHYKINQEHRHCDMPVVLAQRLAPQSRDHVILTLCIFELTLNFLDQMEIDLEHTLKFDKMAA